MVKLSILQFLEYKFNLLVLNIFGSWPLSEEISEMLTSVWKWVKRNIVKGWFSPLCFISEVKTSTIIQDKNKMSEKFSKKTNQWFCAVSDSLNYFVTLLRFLPRFLVGNHRFNQLIKHETRSFISRYVVNMKHDEMLLSWVLIWAMLVTLWNTAI